jgi:hypothetical protein
MATEEYAVGYAEGYQTGWNEAIDSIPPAAQRQWVGLTEDEMYLNCPNWLSQEQSKVWIQQIEAKLREKNT